MTKVCTISLVAALCCVATGAVAQSAGDPKRGGEAYRACVGCHALQPGVHTTGPSLGGVWGAKAGTAKGFVRYSKEMQFAGITWDEDTLNAWLADPRSMVPGTYMVFRGIENDQTRADVIAFLKIAMAPGGVTKIVEGGLVPQGYAEGQIPAPLKLLPPSTQVAHVRHCGDSFFVTTADGIETPYWEMNVRLKLDSRSTGPEAGKPVIVGAGMAGDRFSIIFFNLDELSHFVTEGC